MNLVRIVEDELDKIYSKTTVINLCKDKVTDYERGVIAGNINALNRLIKILTTDKELSR